MGQCVIEMTRRSIPRPSVYRNAQTARLAGGSVSKTHQHFTRYREKLKAQMIAAYGGSCVCCGESEPKFLTTDHAQEDGGKHRLLTYRSGGHMYWRRLRQEGWPKCVRLLCFNCHMARTYYGGQCPHEAFVPEHEREAV